MAETDYLEAVSLSDLFVDAYDALGLLNMKKDLNEEALEYLRRGTEISPLNALRQMHLGEALLETGHFEAAERAFKFALELDPTQTHAFNRIGISLRRQGKLEEALRYFLQAMEVTADDENLFYNVARVHQDQGDRAMAASYLEKALQLNPDFEKARDLLDRIRPGAG